MKELNTIVCNTNYDKDILKIKNFNLHKELLPFIGYNYEKSKLLLVGESHYVKKDNLSKADMINMYADWYNRPTEDIENAMIYRDWFTTRNVIKNFQCRYRSKAHTMFSNPAKVMMKILGDKCPTDTAAFSCVSFCNYFQRPSLEEGKSINPIYLNEETITAEIFEELIKIIKPKGIIFLSKKAYSSFMKFKNKEYPIFIDFVHHPTSPWWYKNKGKEKFVRIVENFISENTLQVQLKDERIWLMKNLFKDIEKGIVNRGYNLKICPDEFIYNFYSKPRLPFKLPYIEVLNRGNKVKIEIDSRIYVWKNEKDWEYLPIGSKKIKKDSKFDTPNFRNFNKAYRDLFDEESRKKFVNISLDFISKLIE